MSTSYDSHGKPHAEKTHDVTVVGSVNADLAIRLDELPPAGQTVRGSDAERGPGRQGRQPGRRRRPPRAQRRDGRGRRRRRRGARAARGAGRRRASTSSTSPRSTCPTGVAVVLVHGGESTIVLSPGANDRMDGARVRAARGGRQRRPRRAAAVRGPRRGAAGRGPALHRPAGAQPRPRPAAAGRAARPRRPAGAQRGGAGGPGRREPRRPRRRGDRRPGPPRSARPAPRSSPAASAARSSSPPAGTRRSPAVPARPGRRRPRRATASSRPSRTPCWSGAGLLEAAHWAARVAAVTVSRAGASQSLPRKADVPPAVTAPQPGARRVSVGWGFVGTGGIARTVARALELAPGGRLVAVASRDLSGPAASPPTSGTGDHAPTTTWRRCSPTPPWTPSTSPPPTPSTTRRRGRRCWRARRCWWRSR